MLCPPNPTLLSPDMAPSLEGGKGSLSTQNGKEDFRRDHEGQGLKH